MKPLTEARDWRLVHGAVVLLVLGLFLWELGDVLSPLVLFLALIALMSPYSGSPFHRLLVLTTGVLAAFVLAFVLAYVLDPTVDRLERARLPRSLAILVLSLPVIGVLALLVFLGVPALADQIQSLIRRVPDALEQIAGWIEGLRVGILGIDLPFVDEEDLARRLRGISPAAVISYLEAQQAEIAGQAWRAVLGLGRGLGTVFTILGYVVLTPVLTFYLLRDWDALVERISSYVPRPRYDRWSAFMRDYDHLLSRYLRGQLLAAAIVGVLTWIGLWIAGFPYSGLVGAVAGVFNIVPYLGLVVSLVPALIIAVISGSFLTSVLKVAIVFAIVQFLDGNILGPRIVGESVGLHPVWVILAIATAGFFFGFVGLLLALPAAILVKLLAQAGSARYRESTLYLGSGPSPG